MKARAVAAAMSTRLVRRFAACAAGVLVLWAAAALAQQAPAAKTRQLSLENKPWTGDFDQMLERRAIRVLLPYSRSLFYVDKGHERGIEAELVRDFEQYVNRTYAKRLRKRPITVYIITVTRDKLLPGVVEGLGDIAGGNLTVTEKRRETVDFVVPADRKPVRELVVTGPSSPQAQTLDDLSGRTVHVRETSSYYESLLALNERLHKAGKAPARIVILSDALEDEDKLEMLNAGLLEFLVVDEWKARMWAQVLPNVRVREDLVLRAEGYTGMALRKGSPALAAVLTDFFRNVERKRGGIEARQAKYHRRVKQISNNTAGAEWRRFQQTLELFEKYGARYGFDPLMLAAQGFQESKLRQEARSASGAIGVMQLMPETGKALRVGDITRLEPNIHGGAKYLDQLMTKYFVDANFSDDSRTLFAFASYNAGPGNIARMRKEAAKRGLDPDQWFNNVEIVVAERIGLETTTYVRNIYKYYTAYRLALEAQEARLKAREQLRPGKT